MGTVINTNVTALNSHRSMKIVGETTQKASEKLSSGLRINRAGDDAAGLAISEKMRSQIRGLNQASRNSQDGISLIQTAEGALQETEDMLQRMRELVNQAANDTNEATDRDKIALELDQLSKEIDATAEKTEFNKKKLIDGSWEAKQLYLQVGANEIQNISFGIEGMNSSRLGVTMNEIGTVVRNAGIDNNQTNVQGAFGKVASGAAATAALGVSATEASQADGLGENISLKPGTSAASQAVGLGGVIVSSEASMASGLGGADKNGQMMFANGSTLTFNADGSVTASGEISELNISAADTLSAEEAKSALRGVTLLLGDNKTFVTFNAAGDEYAAVDISELTAAAANDESSGAVALDTLSGSAVPFDATLTSYSFEVTAIDGTIKLTSNVAVSGWTDIDTGATYDTIEDLSSALSIKTKASVTAGDSSADATMNILDSNGNLIVFEIADNAGTAEITIKSATAADLLAAATTANDATISGNNGISTQQTFASLDSPLVTFEFADGSELIFNGDGSIEANGTLNAVLSGVTVTADGSVNATDLANLSAVLGNGDVIKFNEDGTAYQILTAKQLSKDEAVKEAIANATNATTPPITGIDLNNDVNTTAIGDTGYSYAFDSTAGTLSLSNINPNIDVSKLVNVTTGESVDLSVASGGEDLATLGLDASAASSATFMDQEGNLLKFTTNASGELTITTGSIDFDDLDFDKGSTMPLVPKTGTMVFSDSGTPDSALIFNADGTVSITGNSSTIQTALGITAKDINDDGTIDVSLLANKTLDLGNGTIVRFNETGDGYKATDAKTATKVVDEVLASSTASGSFTVGDQTYTYEFDGNGNFKLDGDGVNPISFKKVTDVADDFEEDSAYINVRDASAMGTLISGLSNGESLSLMDDYGNVIKIAKDSSSGNISITTGTLEDVALSSAGDSITKTPAEQGEMILDDGSKLKFNSDGSIISTKSDGTTSTLTTDDLKGQTLTLSDGRDVNFNSLGTGYTIGNSTTETSTVREDAGNGTMVFSGKNTLSFNEDGTVSASGEIKELGISGSGTVTAAILKNKTAQLADGTFVQFNSTGTGYKMAAAPGLTTSDPGNIDSATDITTAQAINTTGYTFTTAASSSDISFVNVGTGMKNVDGTAINNKEQLEDAVNSLANGKSFSIIDDSNNIIKFSRDSSGALSISSGKLDFSSSTTIRVEEAKSNSGDLSALGAMQTLDGAIIQFTDNGELSVSGTLKDTNNNVMSSPQSGTSYNLAESTVDQAKLAGRSILTDKGTITFSADGTTATLDPNKTSAGLIESGEHKTRNGSTVETDSTGKVIGVSGKVTTHDGKEIGDGAKTNIEDLAGKTIRLEDGRYVSFDANLKASVSDDISNIPNTERNELAEKADKEAAAALELNLNAGESSPGKKISSLLVKIDAAIESVSSQRANLGALQNRLEHTIKNVDTASENLSAAESRIRDTDMAAEMMNFTKSNVLSQAAMSMLAQANQAPNNVLSLLR